MLLNINQDWDYSTQLETKVNWLQELLSPWTRDSIQVFQSPVTQYRMRAEFRIWHEGDISNYSMYHPGTKQVYSVTDFPAATKVIGELMKPLLDTINCSQMLRRKLFTVEFLASTNNEVVVSLIYHKPLDSEWVQAANTLQENFSINLIGRSRKQRHVFGNDYVTETLHANNESYQIRHIENSFTQPNAEVNQKMVQWACDQASNLSGDLLELYCGAGNFTLPLSRHFGRVFATEVSKSSIKAMRWNIEANAINNVELVRMSAEEVTDAVDEVRSFRRLQHLNLNDYEFQTIFVDPPRAGVDEKTMELVQRYDNIIYVSCNPESLVKNISQLSGSYKIKSSAAFDQFPYTAHLEAGVLLSKY
ncbi:MAG: tRNA (uracil-5-)-methyltransferase [Parasphingorhabdus sp.]|jgi:tRNA (uracil-5-)-methyltransferase